MTLREILNPDCVYDADNLGWSLAEKFYASLGSPRDPAALATFLQRAINTLHRKHIRYPAVFVKRRAQLLGKAADGSTWSPAQAEYRAIEIAEPQAAARTEEQLDAQARATLSPEQFERWSALRRQAQAVGDPVRQAPEPAKSQIIEMRKKSHG